MKSYHKSGFKLGQNDILKFIEIDHVDILLFTGAYNELPYQHRDVKRCKVLMCNFQWFSSYCWESQLFSWRQSIYIEPYTLLLNKEKPCVTSFLWWWPVTPTFQSPFSALVLIKMYFLAVCSTAYRLGIEGLFTVKK